MKKLTQNGTHPKRKNTARKNRALRFEYNTITKHRSLHRWIVTHSHRIPEQSFFQSYIVTLDGKVQSEDSRHKAKYRARPYKWRKQHSDDNNGMHDGFTGTTIPITQFLPMTERVIKQPEPTVVPSPITVSCWTTLPVPRLAPLQRYTLCRPSNNPVL